MTDTGAAFTTEPTSGTKHSDIMKTWLHRGQTSKVKDFCHQTSWCSHKLHQVHLAVLVWDLGYVTTLILMQLVHCKQRVVGSRTAVFLWVRCSTSQPAANVSWYKLAFLCVCPSYKQPTGWHSLTPSCLRRSVGADLHQNLVAANVEGGALS